MSNREVLFDQQVEKMVITATYKKDPKFRTLRRVEVVKEWRVAVEVGVDPEAEPQLLSRAVSFKGYVDAIITAMGPYLPPVVVKEAIFGQKLVQLEGMFFKDIESIWNASEEVEARLDRRMKPYGPWATSWRDCPAVAEWVANAIHAGQAVVWRGDAPVPPPQGSPASKRWLAETNRLAKRDREIMQLIGKPKPEPEPKPEPKPAFGAVFADFDFEVKEAEAVEARSRSRARREEL